MQRPRLRAIVCVTIIAVVALLAAGCTTAGSAPSEVPAVTPSATDPVLDGRTYLSTSVTENGVKRPLAPGTRIRLSFEDGRLGANAGCNSMSGGYSFEGGRLVVGQMASTMMGCEQARAEQDQWLAAFLDARPAVRQDGDTLVLEGPTITLNLLDRKIAEPDLPLVGTQWTIDTVIANDAASSVASERPASLLIDADGRAQIRTGCNSGFATVTIDQAAHTLHLGPIGLTRMACPGPAADLERHVLEVLQSDSVTWSIDASRLNLRAGAVGLGLTAELSS